MWAAGEAAQLGTGEGNVWETQRGEPSVQPRIGWVGEEVRDPHQVNLSCLVREEVVGVLMVRVN